MKGKVFEDPRVKMRKGKIWRVKFPYDFHISNASVVR